MRMYVAAAAVAVPVVMLSGCGSATDTATTTATLVAAPAAGGPSATNRPGTTIGKEAAPTGAADPHAAVSTARGGVTVHPVGPGGPATHLPGLSTSVPTGVALLSAPPARPVAANGRIVAGYPSVLGPAPSSTLLTSGVAPAGTRVQTALTATSTAGTAAVLRFYRGTLSGLGFTESTVPGVAGATVSRFVRRLAAGTDTVTVSAHTAKGRTSYTVFAVLVARG